MSTGLECVILEYRPGEWYYVLEHGTAPKLAYDWREYADAFGPFATPEAARENLHRNHANPGGYWTTPYDPAKPPSEVWDRLIAKACHPTADGGYASKDGKVRGTGPFIFLSW